jgi:hypothetical protein
VTAKRGPFIEPRRTTATVPSALQQLRVAKQDSGDYACGLFALVTAARKLRTTARAGATSLLAGLDTATRRRVEARLPKDGLLEKDVRALARAAGLAVYRPNTHDVAQFREPGWLWMALVLVRFAQSSRLDSYVEKHYVLVVDHLPDEHVFVVADPHPWNPPLYCVDEPMFEAAWRAAKTKGPPWAAALYPAPRHA